jgi:ATP-dependent Clp protease ATP-binding subunit ClpA
MSSNTPRMDTTKAKICLTRAVDIAKQRNHEYVTVEHVLAALLQDPEIIDILVSCEVEVDQVSADLTKYLSNKELPKSDKNPKKTDVVKDLLQNTLMQVMMSSRRAVTPADLLINIAVLPFKESHAAYYLSNHGLDIVVLKGLLSEIQGAARGALGVPNTTRQRGEGDAETPAGDEHNAAEDATQPGITTEEAAKKRAEKLLEKFTINLNTKAATGKTDPLIGREDEVETLVRITARRTKSNVIMVGEPGVGKTQIAEGLAKKIVDKEVPELLLDATIYALDITAILAGSKFRGDVEERVKQVLKALQSINKPILFIDEIHMMLGAGSGGSGSMDIANILKPALSSGEIRCIGSTTYEEYRKHFEKDRALRRRFQKLDINEPSIEDSKRILKGLKPYYEEFHGVTYMDEALDEAVDLAARYISNQYLPDKAIDVIDAAGARQRVAAPDKKKSVITILEIEEEVSKIAKLPQKTVQENESDKLANLHNDLKVVVFGQDEALETVVDAVLTSRAGLREADKTLGNYLFTGPTGTGKTLVATQLAKTLGIEFVRIDCSEYQEKHTVSKLIGSPPGYVGFGDGASGSGVLINAIDKTPHAVLLLDEIEKAHPDVFNILLQIMDYGKLTSSSGKVVDFRNIIVIMTANLGAAEASKRKIGFGDQTNEGAEAEVVTKFFKPEFRNRLDAIVNFKKLGMEHILLVVDKFIGAVNILAKMKNVEIVLTDEARTWLAEKGYDSAMGARPMARVINDFIKKPLSKEMLFGKLKNGGKALANVEDGKLVLIYTDKTGEQVAEPEMQYA